MSVVPSDGYRFDARPSSLNVFCIRLAGGESSVMAPRKERRKALLSVWQPLRVLNRAAKENDAEQAGKEEWSATHEGGPSSAGNESDITSSDSGHGSSVEMMDEARRGGHAPRDTGRKQPACQASPQSN